MEKTYITNLFKNILLLNKHQYKFALLKKIESFVSLMRLKAYFFLQLILGLNPEIHKSSLALKTLSTHLILKN